MLPRKDIVLAQHKRLLEAAAYQAGVLFAIERCRRELRQEDVASSARLAQTDVSHLENGQPVDATNEQIDAAFGAVGLPTNTLHANFVKWWRDNAGPTARRARA